MLRSLLSNHSKARRCSPAIIRMMQRSQLTNTRCPTSLTICSVKGAGGAPSLNAFALIDLSGIVSNRNKLLYSMVPRIGPSYALQPCSGCGWSPQPSIPLLQSSIAESQWLSAINKPSISTPRALELSRWGEINWISCARSGHVLIICIFSIPPLFFFFIYESRTWLICFHGS